MIDKIKLAELKAHNESVSHGTCCWSCTHFKEMADTIEFLWKENVRLRAVAKEAVK